MNLESSEYLKEIYDVSAGQICELTIYQYVNEMSTPVFSFLHRKNHVLENKKDLK